MTHKEKEAFEKAFDEAKQGKQSESLVVPSTKAEMMRVGGLGAQLDWDKEFAAQESWANEFAEQQEKPARTTDDNEKEALARTATMLLDTVDVENNPKFKNSNFMSLMRKLRDREVSIEGNKMVETKGKGKGVGGDWASEFGQRYETTKSWADDFMKQQSRSANGNRWAQEFAMKAERKWAEQIHDHGESSSSATADWAAEFSKSQGAAAAAAAAAPMDEVEMQKVFGKGTELEDWVRQYQQNIAHLKTSQDAEWDSMQKEWEQLRPGETTTGYRANNRDYENYTFMSDNPYLLHPEAIDQAPHNSLADSILALEAKAQLQTSNAAAWQELGFRQQENERDAAAIAALRRAVSMDPSLLDGWLALAVSYTNENCRADTYDALEQWILNNDKYKHLAVRSGKARTQGDRHAYITNLFLEAARSSPGAEMDADVQVGLGVLFNVSEEYPKAIDCFKAALQSRPQVMSVIDIYSGIKDADRRRRRLGLSFMEQTGRDTSQLEGYSRRH